MRSKAYAAAGVDIALGNQLKLGLPQLLASASRKEVLGEVGGFGGLFKPNLGQFQEPVLVSSVDGVGTKLKVAFQCKRHNTIGQDLVNHCVDDIAVLGAEPLFFLDYLASGRITPKTFDAILSGFAKACAENNCALIGGETAQMPDIYQSGEYDVSGTIVGLVDRKRILSGKTIKPGDRVLGLASNGLHTNGYTLARKVLLEKAGLPLKKKIKELSMSLGDELLRVHRSYRPILSKLIKAFNDPNPTRPKLKACAHITGGGFFDNIPRSLPSDCDVQIRLGSWEIQPIFSLIQSLGKIDEDEMHHVFNMGIGMTLIVDPKIAKSMLQRIRRNGIAAWLIGDVKKGQGQVTLD